MEDVYFPGARKQGGPPLNIIKSFFIFLLWPKESGERCEVYWRRERSPRSRSKQANSHRCELWQARAEQSIQMNETRLQRRKRLVSFGYLPSALVGAVGSWGHSAILLF